jgi:hypothetical protein
VLLHTWIWRGNIVPSYTKNHNGNIVNEYRVSLLLLESIVSAMLERTASTHCLLLLPKRVNITVDLAPKRHPCREKDAHNVRETVPPEGGMQADD